MADVSKEHRDRVDALSVQLSRASTLVEQPPVAAELHAHFEGREFYDPHATWTSQEESRVKLRTDIRLLGWLSIMVFGNTFPLYNATITDISKRHIWTARIYQTLWQTISSMTLGSP